MMKRNMLKTKKKVNNQENPDQKAEVRYQTGVRED